MRRPALLALLGLALLAPQSLAATVGLGPQLAGYPDAGSDILIQDSGGEVNRLAVSYTQGAVRSQSGMASSVITVRDSATRPTPGDGCYSIDANGVRCEVEALARIWVYAGPNADAVAVTPAGDATCSCVVIDGGAGDDVIESADAVTADGQDGDDRLIGKPTPATRGAVGAFIDRNNFNGGSGNDVIRGGPGSDELDGGPGDDNLRGGPGDDLMSGRASAPVGSEGPSPGRDYLEGGDGDDVLSDGDMLPPLEGQARPGEVGPDTIIGGRGDDAATSYVDRTEPVTVDLSSRDGDGQGGENDHVAGVEMIYGGLARDTFTGDDAGNWIRPQTGDSYVRAGDGDDIIDIEEPGRHRVRTGRGDDQVSTVATARGRLSCGNGKDRVTQDPTPSGAPTDPASDPGPLIAADCDAVGILDGDFFLPGADPHGALAPRPRLRRRLVRFRRVPGMPSRDGLVLTLTRPEAPFEAIGQGRVRADGVTIRIPRSLARSLARRGGMLRATVAENGSPRTIWRFRF